MSDRRQFIPVTGLIATVAMAAYMIVQLDGQATALSGDFPRSTVAEVQDGQGRTVLHGQFAAATEDDDDSERKASLEATGIDGDASGEAEVEFSAATPARQEIEFSVEHLEPGTSVSFLIDGRVVGQATVDRRGRAELEIDVVNASPPATR